MSSLIGLIECFRLTVSFAHRMPNAGCHAPIQRVLAAAGIGRSMNCEKPLPILELVQQPSVRQHGDGQWMEDRRTSLARTKQRKTTRRKGVTFPARPEPLSVECKSPAPPTDSPPAPSSQIGNSKSTRSDSGDAPTSPTDSLNSHSQYSDEPAILSVEDTDIETVSVGSQTLTESDSASERTRTEEVEPRNLQDKMAFLDLGDPDTQLASVTVLS